MHFLPKYIFVCALVVGLAPLSLCAEYSIPRAAKTASPVSVTIGYYDFQQVKNQIPPPASYFKSNCDFELAVKQIRQAERAKSDNKLEREKLKEELIEEYNGKLTPIAACMPVHEYNGRVARALNQVAREHGLDVILDVSNVMPGKALVIEKGLNVTDEVIRRMDPTPE